MLEEEYMFVLEIAWLWFMRGVNQGEGCFIWILNMPFSEISCMNIVYWWSKPGVGCFACLLLCRGSGALSSRDWPNKMQNAQGYEKAYSWQIFRPFLTGLNNQYYVYSSQFFGCWYICSLAAATLWWNSRADTCIQLSNIDRKVWYSQYRNTIFSLYL